MGDSNRGSATSLETDVVVAYESDSGVHCGE